MEPILKDSRKVKGYEVIYFEEAEIEKVKGNDTAFASFGGLSVIFVKKYARFFFQLNDWRYPLMRRLNISSAVGQGQGRTYILPAPNGYSYSLKILKGSSQAFDNLDTILSMNSKFSVIGKELPIRKLEASPDDKLARRVLKETGPKEIVTETVKQVIQKALNKAATLKTGTKYLTSTKKRINLKEIKNKNFRKEAHSKIKKDFFQSTEKLSNEFLEKRKNNINLSQIKEFDELKKIGDFPTFYLSKEELEDNILNMKDLLNKMAPQSTTEQSSEKKGLMTGLKEAVTGLVSGRTEEKAKDRNISAPEVQSEGMAHYQG